MRKELNETAPSDQTIPTAQYWRRVAWIGIQLILVYSFMDEFRPFFYQAF